MNKTTQREMVLDYLKENRERFVPVYEPIGERQIGGVWVLFSHRTPARLTELFQDGLVDRKMIKGKTGARYYAYKYRSQEPTQVDLF